MRQSLDLVASLPRKWAYHSYRYIMFVLTEIQLWKREREGRRRIDRMCGGGELLPPHIKYTHTFAFCGARHHHRSFAAVWEFNQILCRFACRTLPAKRKLIEFTLLIESKNFNLFAFVGGVLCDAVPIFCLCFYFLLVAAVCVQKRVLAESLSDKCKSNLSLRFAVTLCLVLYISQIMWKKFEPFLLFSRSVSDFFLINFLPSLFSACSYSHSLARLLLDGQFHFYFILLDILTQVFSRLHFHCGHHFFPLSIMLRHILVFMVHFNEIYL